MSLENFWLPEQESIRRESEELNEEKFELSDIPDASQNTTKDPSSSGNVMSARVTESLLRGVETPADVLALPQPIRRHAIRHIKEALGNQRFETAQIYVTIVRTIDTVWKEEGSLTGIIPKVKAVVEELNIDPDNMQKIERILLELQKSLDILAKYEGLPPETLLETFARPAWFLSPASDTSRDAQVTPYAVDIVIESPKDFAKYISGTIDEATVKRKDTRGLCYTVKGVPITASIGSYDVKNTQAHERQHKLFRIVDTVLEPEHLAAWRARDELLAFFAGESVWSWTKPYEHLKESLASPSYKFDEKYGMAKDQYQRLIDEGIQAMASLWENGLTSNEIIGILSFEPLRTWKKIARRMMFSDKMRSTVMARRVELNKQRITRANEIKKESDRKIKIKLENLPTPTLSIIERQNPQGRFYRKISRRNLSVHLNELGLTVDERNILLDKPIDEAGIHKVPITLHFETIYIDVEIKAI